MKQEGFKYNKILGDNLLPVDIVSDEKITTIFETVEDLRNRSAKDGVSMIVEV